MAFNVPQMGSSIVIAATDIKAHTKSFLNECLIKKKMNNNNNAQ